ncbi:hypothetical protein FRC00_012243 [Tulasnella sp. 408]|nr:hypothetical protein FRC00_012243 [Tulasnella sp. 408]
MPDDSYRLRRVPAPDAPSGSGRNNKSPANAVAADAAAIEDIIRRTLQEVQSTSAPGASTSNGNPTTSPPASSAHPAADSPAAPASSSNPEDVASLRTQLSSLQKTYNEAIQALEQGRLAYQTLEHKHQQFVDANVAFTHWRDDMERQRAAWADANAKFAKRHEEHKAARANLEAKYSAVLGDLEELKERYERAKKEIERLSGQAPPPSPPLPSAVARPGDPLGPLEKRKKSSIGGTSTTAPSRHSIRGVERDASGKELHHRQPVYPPQLVEQSVLRERLTSDMFTLSQKVLEERATRAEEARQMAERRIFELESQHPVVIDDPIPVPDGKREGQSPTDLAFVLVSWPPVGNKPHNDDVLIDRSCATIPSRSSAFFVFALPLFLPLRLRSFPASIPSASSANSFAIPATTFLTPRQGPTASSTISRAAVTASASRLAPAAPSDPCYDRSEADAAAFAIGPTAVF